MLPVSVKYLIMLRTMVLVTAPPRQIYPVNLLKFQNLFLILSRSILKKPTSVYFLLSLPMDSVLRGVILIFRK